VIVCSANRRQSLRAGKGVNSITSLRPNGQTPAMSEAHLHGGPLEQPSHSGPHAGDALHLVIEEGGFRQPVCAPQPLLPSRKQARLGSH